MRRNCSDLSLGRLLIYISVAEGNFDMFYKLKIYKFLRFTGEIAIHGKILEPSASQELQGTKKYSRKFYRKREDIKCLTTCSSEADSPSARHNDFTGRKPVSEWQ